VIGSTILHYKILEKLGEGGMGVVYKAHDTKLKRDVAIKFLPRRISANGEERERFKIEAQAAAALNHPNIATIHAIEESNDEMFIVMEYIEGQELKDIISQIPPGPPLGRGGTDSPPTLQNADRGGFIPTNTIIHHATQIAGGLQAAHEKGVIHRDIKSSNIMITEKGQIKIMDFGLAKVRGSDQVTKVGTTVGTVAYMSPEQARAEKVDHQSDIWSFGVVLYEMLTGQVPFLGDYDQATLYAIINESPKPVASIRTDVPTELIRIVEKCLAKKADERYQNITELLKDINSLQDNTGSLESLRHLSTSKVKKRLLVYVLFALLFSLLIFVAWHVFNEKNADDVNSSAPEQSLKSIAVIPFTNISNDPETNYLGFALSDQIISSLAYIKELTVRPSSAVRVYQNQSPDPMEVAKRLNVDYLLSGSYLKEDNTIRLNLELVEIHSSELIWHESIEMDYENTFKLQDIVSEKVVTGLKVKFSPEIIIVTHNGTQANPVAYEYFLRALSYPFTLDSLKLAIDLFQKSIDLDSTFAPAYSELGYRYQLLANYDFKERKKLEDAEAAYKKALSLNGSLLNALGHLALLYTETDSAAHAVTLVHKALKINPNSPESHFWLGYIYRYTGLLDEAVREMERAVQLDPTNPRFRSLGLTYIYLQRYDDALAGLDLDRGSPYSLSWKGNLYLRWEKPDLAKQFLEKAIAKEPGGSVGFWSKAMLNFIEGKREEGLRMLKTLETSNVFDGEQFYNYANLYGLYGMKDDCIRLIKKAVDHGFYCYPFMQEDIFLVSLRDNEEFKNVLNYAKSKHEAFKKQIE